MTSGNLEKLLERLREILDEDEILASPEERAFYSADVYSAGVLTALAIRPRKQQSIAPALALISAAGFAVLARGGGMSYTGGYVPERENSVVVDLSGLNQIISINEDDLVITVESGVTWRQIHEALTPLGLRLPFFGTFSGDRATVGGGLSNGALFMGTGRHGTAAEIVVGMEIATLKGDVVCTGQGGFTNGRPGFRHYGPDLTGLFVHDAGSLGVKTLASLRMIEAPRATGFLSFAFADEFSVVTALSAIARSGAAEEAYVFDPATTARSLEPGSLLKDLKRLKSVVGQERSWLKGLLEGASVLGAGRRFADPSVYTLHVVCAGRSEAAVAEDIALCKGRAEQHGGVPIANTIPKAARGNPFEPVNGILGKDGERWAALNAKVPHSDAKKLIGATRETLAPYAARMEACGVSMSFLYIAIANHIFSYEPVLRWHDEWLPIHKATPEPAYLGAMSEPPPNPEARALVHEIRTDIVHCFARFGAASNQIGKTYLHQESMQPRSRRLLAAIKRDLDPAGLMNPGALEGLSR